MTKSKGKMKKRITIISRIIFFIFLIITLAFLGLIISLQAIPMKYVLPAIIIYFVMTLIFGVLTWKRNIKSGIKVGTNLILIVFIVGSGFGLSYLTQTVNFMNKIKAKDYQLEDYYVLVLKDSKYQKIDDLKGKTISVNPNETASYEDALKELNQMTNFETKEYKDFATMGKNLINKTTEAIFITSSHKSILEEEDDTFEAKVKIIATVSVKVKNEVEKKEAKVTEESFNIYISGIDIYGSISSVSRSDVNMIVTVNPNTHKILLTSIPRDYYVQLHGKTGYKDKLTHSGVYGIDTSVQTIEDLLSIDINYYIRVNFTTLINLVDAIGGIDIDSQFAFTAASGDVFHRGINHMNGELALAYSRERHSFVDGDRQRGKNQQQVLSAILNKTLSSKTLITRYSNILNSLSNSFQTNMPSNKIYELVNMQLDQMPSWTIESYNLDGVGASEYTYTYQHQKLYVMVPNEETVNAARDKIDTIEKGV